MNEAAKPTDEEADELPIAEVQAAKRWGWLWLFPLAAAAIAGVLTWSSLGERGIPIRIAFKQGHGLKAGDPLRYRGIDVGKVESIELGEQLAGIVAEVRLLPSASDMAREGSRFWIVRPTLDLSGPKGLETVVGAKYLQAFPGTGTEQLAFTGLEEAPMIGEDDDGLEITLVTTQAEGLTAGAPVSYRQVPIGSLTSVQLSEDRKSVTAQVNIKPKHKGLIRSRTRFWKTGGARFSADLLQGINVDVGSVNSLLLGGVSIATPLEDDGGPVLHGHSFVLHDAPQAEWESWNGEAPPSQDEPGLEIRLLARKAGGLNVGSPVTYRQVTVGNLLSVVLSPGGSNVVVRARIDAVHRELVNSHTVFWKAGGAKFTAGLLKGIEFDMESLHSVVAGGVSLARPPKGGEPVSEGHSFILYEEPDEDWEDWLDK